MGSLYSLIIGDPSGPSEAEAEVEAESRPRRVPELELGLELGLEPCPCGGGQSCIVMRRSFGEWVHEDEG